MNAYARVYQMHASEFTVSMLRAILRGWTTCPMLWEQLRKFFKFLEFFGASARLKGCKCRFGDIDGVRMAIVTDVCFAAAQVLHAIGTACNVLVYVDPWAID